MSYRNTTRKITALGWLATVLTLMLANAGLAGNTTGIAQQVAPKAIEGKAADAAPESRAEGGLAIDAAVAAALIGAISTQFGERDVEVKLDRVRMDPQNLIDITVSGDGRLQIGKDDEWLPFRFTSLYDSVKASVNHPRLTLGTDEPGEELETDSAMARQLQDRVSARLRQEFGQQSPQFAVDKLSMTPAGKRYARVAALGTAQFGKEGTAGASVSALYDRRSGDWLRVEYELGSTSNRSVDAPEAP